MHVLKVATVLDSKEELNAFTFPNNGVKTIVAMNTVLMTIPD